MEYLEDDISNRENSRELIEPILKEEDLFFARSHNGKVSGPGGLFMEQ